MAQAGFQEAQSQEGRLGSVPTPIRGWRVWAWPARVSPSRAPYLIPGRWPPPLCSLCKGQNLPSLPPGALPPLLRLSHGLHTAFLGPSTGPSPGRSDGLSRTPGLSTRGSLWVTLIVSAASASSLDSSPRLAAAPATAPSLDLCLGLEPTSIPRASPPFTSAPRLFGQHPGARFLWGFSNSNIPG